MHLGTVNGAVECHMLSRLFILLGFSNFCLCLLNFHRNEKNCFRHSLYRSHQFILWNFIEIRQSIGSFQTRSGMIFVLVAFGLRCLQKVVWIGGSD